MDELTEDDRLYLALETNERFHRAYLQAVSKRAINEPLVSFGTSGLRANMQSGWRYLNTATVRRCCLALSKCVVASFPSQASQLLMVIGYDHRQHSLEFADCAARTLAGRGINVLLMQDVIATPLLAYAVRMFEGHAGIMITASHNPRQDNGLKVYGQKGCQLVGQLEKQVMAEMRALTFLSLKEEYNYRPDGNDNINNKGHGKVTMQSPQDVFMHYRQRLHSDLGIRAELLEEGVPRMAYTPVHGVGWQFVRQLLPEGVLEVVPEQRDPHADFPTVTYPNPEDGWPVLRLARQLADRHHLPLIVATDPDVDRFALAERTNGNAENGGGWRLFTGNELACMFAVHLWHHHRPQDVADPKQVVMLTTAVSSQFLAELMAPQEGFSVQSTLTGFKHLGNLAYDLRESGKRVLLAYEESIGYMVGMTVLEKDGLGALMLCAHMARHLYHVRRITFGSFLEECYQRYGRVLERNGHFRCESQVISAIFRDIRSQFFPASSNDSNDPNDREQREMLMQALEVTDVQDYHPSQFVKFAFEDGWMAVRASGTEPKLKYYSELFVSAKDALGLEYHFQRLNERVDLVLKRVVRVDARRLKRPNDDHSDNGNDD